MYESWFLKANDPSGQRALWLRFTLLSPNGQPDHALAETWAIVFDRGRGRHHAAKQAHALAAARIADDGSRIEIADAVLEPGHTAGTILSGEGPIRWDLSFTTRSFLHRPFPAEAMYAGPLPKHKLVTPYPDERFDGWITVGDERLDVRDWAGMQGHNWGTEHTYLYAWCHCNVLGSPDTWFEGMSGRVKIGPLVMPWLGLATLTLGGRRIHFDGPRAVLRGRIDLGRQPRKQGNGAPPGWGWTFAFDGPTGRIEGRAAGDRSDFVGLTYANPDGAETHCLNSKTAHLELTLHERGAEPIRLESEAAALEVGTRQTDHGIRVVL